MPTSAPVVNDDFLSVIADRLCLDRGLVSMVADQLFLALHTRSDRRRNLNRDFIAGVLHRVLSEMSFYHLLGFLDTMCREGSWEPGYSSEYLMRLGGAERWQQFKNERFPDESTGLGIEAIEIVKALQHRSPVAEGIHCSIDEMFFEPNQQRYAKLTVDDELLSSDDGRTYVDYIPVSKVEVEGLRSIGGRCAALELVIMSRNRRCISQASNGAHYVNYVFHPHL